MRKQKALTVRLPMDDWKKIKFTMDAYLKQLRITEPMSDGAIIRLLLTAGKDQADAFLRK